MELCTFWETLKISSAVKDKMFTPETSVSEPESIKRPRREREERKRERERELHTMFFLVDELEAPSHRKEIQNDIKDHAG
jgi:hypothetical protein